MIKSLKRKFIVISMFSVILVLSVIIGIINIANFYSVNQSNNIILDTLAENDGTFPVRNNRDLTNDGPFDDAFDNSDKGFTVETPFETRYFTVVLDSAGNVIEARVDHIAAVSAESAGELAQEVSESGKKSGYKGNYKYRVTTNKAKTVCIFVDCSSALSNFKTFLFASIFVSLLGLLLIFVLIVFLSDRAIKPVAESYKKQKQFITDAGHELKTPITVISANAEVLEIENGENKWIDSIKNQVSKLSKLTQQLIDLSRFDEGLTSSFSEFSLSEAVEETVSSFLPVAKNENKTVQMDITPNINYNGDERGIRSLVSILMDNAIKYSDDDGLIIISLTNSSRHITLSVYNTADNVDIKNINMLFERFYRGDTSHNSQKEGYGIGLSIAKSVAENHKGKISVKSEDGKSIEFTVKL